MRILIAVLLLLGASVYWFVGDGSTPKNADFEFPISEMRALIDAEEGALPVEINVEMISTDEAPILATHAGFNTKLFQLAMTSYQVKGVDVDIIIGSAFDRGLFDSSKQSDDAAFNENAYDRMHVAMLAANAVYITHEHIDHLGGIARAPDPAALTPKLMLSKPQITAIADLSVNRELAAPYKALQPTELSAPRLLAPGVAVAPAPGHTPGSVVFLVRIEDGQEYLLLGDIVWSMKNVEKAWGRPRLLQHMFFPVKENRKQVQRQVRALHDLAIAEPGLIMLPSHDKLYLDRLIAAGQLGGKFE